MTRNEDLFDQISDEEMARLLDRTVERGTRIRRRNLAFRASLVAMALCVIAIPLSLSLARDGSQPASTGTAITRVTAGPFQDVVWKHVEYPGVNFSKVTYPGNFGCNPGSRYGFAPEVQQVTYIRPTDGGTRIALVLVRCDNGSNAPSSLYAFTVEAGSTHPHLLQTLLAAPKLGFKVIWYATSFSISKDAVILPLRGVTGSAPLCCPNVTETMRWALAGDHFLGQRQPIRRIPPTCLSTQLAAEPGRFEVTADNVEGTVSLKNTSSTTFSLVGYPLVQMLDSNGQPLATEESFTNLSQYAAIVTLAPSSVASFNLGYPDATRYGTASCPTSAELNFIYNGLKENEITMPLRIQPYGGSTVAKSECGQIKVSVIYPGNGDSRGPGTS